MPSITAPTIGFMVDLLRKEINEFMIRIKMRLVSVSESVRLYQTKQCRVCDCKTAVLSSLVRGDGIVGDGIVAGG